MKLAQKTLPQITYTSLQLTRSRNKNIRTATTTEQQNIHKDKIVQK